MSGKPGLPIDARRMAAEWQHFGGYGIKPTAFAARMGVSVDGLARVMARAGRVGRPFHEAYLAEKGDHKTRRTA